MTLLEAVAIPELMLFVGMVVGSALHELGHALASVLTASGLRSVSIGTGPAVLRWRIGGVWFVVHALPIGGRVVTLPRSHAQRRASAWISASGMLVNLALLGIMLTADWAWPELYDTAWEPLGLAQLLILAVTAVPVAFKSHGVPIATDGLKLWRLMVGRDPDMVAACHRLLMRLVLPAGAPIPPLSPASKELQYQVFRTDRVKERWAARDTAEGLKALLARDDLGLAERAAAIDLLLSSALLMDAVALDADCLDAYSSQAVRLCRSPTTLVTRGGALVALGRWQEAEALLTEVLPDAKVTLLPASSRAYLAGALAGQGRMTEARAWMEQARAAVPAPIARQMKPMMAYVRTKLLDPVPVR